jgi:limonene-1,2-epoxide hydrolase
VSAGEDLVERFCAAWSERDIEKLLAFFTEDAVYHNIPIEPVTGNEGIRNLLQLFIPGSESITFEIRNIAAAGDVVFTERVDRFAMGERTVELPVAGVFEIRDGKIAAWRDYFDMGTWLRQTT